MPRFGWDYPVFESLSQCPTRFEILSRAGGRAGGDTNFKPDGTLGRRLKNSQTVTSGIILFKKASFEKVQ